MWRGAQTAALREVWCEQMKKTRGKLARTELLQNILLKMQFLYSTSKATTLKVEL